jgi:hypothetical protein
MNETTYTQLLLSRNNNWKIWQRLTLRHKDDESNMLQAKIATLDAKVESYDKLGDTIPFRILVWEDSWTKR